MENMLKEEQETLMRKLYNMEDMEENMEIFLISALLCCVLIRSPVREMGMNHEVAVFQPQRGTAMDLGS